MFSVVWTYWGLVSRDVLISVAFEERVEVSHERFEKAVEAPFFSFSTGITVEKEEGCSSERSSERLSVRLSERFRSSQSRVEGGGGGRLEVVKEPWEPVREPWVPWVVEIEPVGGVIVMS